MSATADERLAGEDDDPLVIPVEIPGVAARAWFTGRVRRPAPGRDGAPGAPGQPGNLSHRRPHVPARLAADRRAAFGRMGLTTDDLVWMRQVHGRDVAVVDERTPRGAEIDGVDALVTRIPGRALVVQVADCVPLLLSSPAGVVAAVHAGRRGVELGVVPAALEVMARLGAAPASVRAVLGPAIGGCCYEVPSELREDVSDDHPVAAGTTTWGTPSLDLPAAVEAMLDDRGVARVERVGGCTHCDPASRWFSHRRDADAGRQVGVVVLDEAA